MFRSSAAPPGRPACDADNGGIKLPQGFCAAVVADNVGRARHIMVAPNGDVFVTTQTGRGGAGGGIVALRDADGDGKLETKEQFGSRQRDRHRLRNGYLYYATPTQIIRYKLPAGQLKPTGDAEIVATDLPERRQHADKGLAFDGKGGVYVNFGVAVERVPAARSPAERAGTGSVPAARDLCRHLQVRREQARTEAGRRQALRHRTAAGCRPHLARQLAVVRDAQPRRLDTMWPGKFTAEQNAEWPAEYLVKGTERGRTSAGRTASTTTPRTGW